MPNTTQGSLDREFYKGADVTAIARALLGKVISTCFDEELTEGLIIETEAYAGENDRASHAFGGKRSARTEPMYAEGGMAYIYLCYGLHHLFNVVTNVEGTAHAVLLRGILPIHGKAIMARRRGLSPDQEQRLTTTGPATASQALGIHTRCSGSDLLQGPIRILDQGHHIAADSVISGPRIGVDYAGADALLPYRFRIAPSRLASLRKTLQH